MPVFIRIYGAEGYISIMAYINTGAKMGRTMIELPNGIERQFRSKVALKYGGKKGALGKAIKEAIELWLKQQK